MKLKALHLIAKAKVNVRSLYGKSARLAEIIESDAPIVHKHHIQLF